MLTEKQIQAAALVAQGNLSLDRIAEKVGCGSRTLDDWKALPEFQTEVTRYAEDVRSRVTQRGIGNRDRRLRTLNTLLRRSTGFLLERTRMMEAQISAEVQELESEGRQAEERAEELRDYRRQRQAELAGCRSNTDRKAIAEEIETIREATHAAEETARTCRRKVASLQSALPMVRSGLARMELKSLHVGEKAYEVVHEFFYDRELSSEIRALMEQAAVETGQWKNKLTLENPDGTALQTGITVTFVSSAKREEEAE